MANYPEFFRGRNQVLGEKEKLAAHLAELEEKQAAAQKALKFAEDQQRAELEQLERARAHIATLSADLDKQLAQVEADMLQSQRDAIARLRQGRKEFDDFALRFNAGVAQFAALVQELNSIEHRFRDDCWSVDEKPFLHLSGFKNASEALDLLPVLTPSEVHSGEWLLQQMGGAKSRGVAIPGFESEA